jgi:dihydroxycyclohexadiene carboxylate dehydrogenase
MGYQNEQDAERYLLERGHGVIVNVGSVAMRGIFRVPYAAAKGGVRAITVTLAYELAEHGIRVNAIAPGGTDVGQRAIPRNPQPLSEQERAWSREVREQNLHDSYIKRYATPDEQAAAIAFLAAPEASYITGHVLPVSAGTPI